MRQSNPSKNNIERSGHVQIRTAVAAIKPLNNLFRCIPRIVRSLIVSEDQKENDTHADEPPPFPPKGARKPVSVSPAAGAGHSDDVPPPFPPTTAKPGPAPSASSLRPEANRLQTGAIHRESPQQPPTAVPLTPLSIPKSVAIAMTVAVSLPLVISTVGTLVSLLADASDVGGVRSAWALRLSFLQNGFALFACVATLRRTKRYWLPIMGSILTVTSWFWLSFTSLPMGLIVVGTVASFVVGIWSFFVVRKPEVRFGFDAQFDPVDSLWQIVRSRIPNLTIAQTPANISRASVLGLSGLCVLGILIGGLLQAHDERVRKSDEARRAEERQAESLANETKQIQETKEKLQRALTQFDVNKGMAADTLYEAWHYNSYYDKVLDEMSREMTMDQQQKLFQLKEMIQPRIDKVHAETEEWLRHIREEREKDSAHVESPEKHDSSELPSSGAVSVKENGFQGKAQINKDGSYSGSYRGDGFSGRSRVNADGSGEGEYEANGQKVRIKANAGGGGTMELNGQTYQIPKP